jgi:cell pole-organizing protein PopZ
MSSPQLTHADEEARLAAAESDLAHDFPHVDRDVIHDLVQRAYAHLMPAKVRDYLPLLVAREVRSSLRQVGTA